MVTRYVRGLVLGLAVLLFSGCANFAFFESATTLQITEKSQRDNLIVDDFVVMVQKYLAPAQTVFFIPTKGVQANSIFNKNIEFRLRQVGYMITKVKSSGVEVDLRWHIDNITTKIVRATYDLNYARVSRLYREVNNNYMPLGQFTVTGLGKARFRPKKLPARIVIGKRSRINLKKPVKAKAKLKNTKKRDKNGR